ncbi:PKD domain-containing protein, partial [Candidatus Parcubacteria bacterium]
MFGQVVQRIVVLAMVIGVLGGIIPHSAFAAIFEPGFEVETVASGFVLPTAMAFAPDGRIFIAQKGGTVRVVKDGVLLPDPVITLTDINTFGDRGLIGIATDPNFLSNGYLYLSYTYENTPGSNFSGSKTGRIVRVTMAGDSADESTKIVLVGTVDGNATSPSCDDFPVTADCIPSDSPSHSVGGLRFGPDGYLYATLGDGAHFDFADVKSLRAQNIDSLAGKLLRINPDGTAPSDNPFFNGDPNANRSKVYAYGLRNAFRLNFHPITGALYLGDVGWSTWEEINHVVPGANFGWPCWEGNGLTTHNCTAASDVAAPLYTYAHNSAGAGSVTAGAFPTGGAYPSTYDHSFFFGDYAQNFIKRLVLDANGNFVSVADFMDDPNGPVDISTGPDGNIYYLAIYTGDLMRLTHTTGNRRPVPNISATPTSGLAPLEVTFSSAGSSDPDGDGLSYAWNFGDGGTSALANPVYTYAANGTYSATLTLTDIHGSAASKTVIVTVGNQVPSANIASPSSGTLYVPGNVIDLVGVGNDPEDGALPESAYHWAIILHHNTHIHHFQEFTGSQASFIAPDHSALDVYVEVVLTVTDSGGLQTSRSANLYLNHGTGSGNLITNPSMEIEAEGTGNPFAWHRGNFGVNDPVYTYPVPGFHGDKAGRVELLSHTDGNAKWFFDPVFVTPGAMYLFSDQYTATVPSALVVQYGFSDGTYQYMALGSVPPVAAPTLVERILTVPAGAQTLSVFHEIDVVGALTTDNFSLTLIPNDTVAPTASLTAPADGSSVSGIIEVTADAADNVGVAG